MTKDKTIRIAEQAGFVIDQEAKKYQPNCISYTHYLIDEQLTRFEALVRADEREECAKVCEDEIKRVKPIYSVVAENALKAIRARGET